MDNNIVVCADHNYGKYVSILFESIILNTNVNINFYVVYSTINDDDRENIKKIVEQKSGNKVIFMKFDIHNELKKINYTTELPSFRGGYDAYTRLFLPKLLKEYSVGSCVYLDVDIIVNKNIDSIFELLNNTKIISGVLDTITIKGNHSLTHNKYINSGVLLMNLNSLEKMNFTVQSLDYAKNKVDELVFPDQDIINNVFPKEENCIEIIDFIYNMYYSKSSKVKKGIILHFIGEYKPWQENCRWRYKKCVWVKYKIATSMFLHGRKVTPAKISAIGFVLALSRPLFNLCFELKMAFGIIKK